MTDLIAFARGVPAADMLPVDAIRKASTAALDSDPYKVLSYGPGNGWQPLRAWIAAQYDVDEARVVTTTGSLQGFALLIQVIRQRAIADNRRPRVIVESPSYDRPLILLHDMGFDVVSVPCDESGVNVEGVAAALEQGHTDFIYVIPTFQNPSGSTMPEAARQRLLSLASEHSVPIFEDDPYGQLYFDAPPPPQILTLDSTGPVWHSGSFSKTVAPGLRVGWMILDELTAREVATAANNTYISPDFLAAETLHQLLVAGALDSHLPKVRAQLKDRSDRLVAAIDQHLPNASYFQPRGGYFQWLQLPDQLSGDAVCAEAANHGVTAVPGSSFGAEWTNWVRLAFSSPPVDQLDDGIARLANAVSECSAHRHAPLNT